jgi:hypothetical protein
MKISDYMKFTINRKSQIKIYRKRGIAQRQSSLYLCNIKNNKEKNENNK